MMRVALGALGDSDGDRVGGMPWPSPARPQQCWEPDARRLCFNASGQLANSRLARQGAGRGGACAVWQPGGLHCHNRLARLCSPLLAGGAEGQGRLWAAPAMLEGLLAAPRCTRGGGSSGMGVAKQEVGLRRADVQGPSCPPPAGTPVPLVPTSSAKPTVPFYRSFCSLISRDSFIPILQGPCPPATGLHAPLCLLSPICRSPCLQSLPYAKPLLPLCRLLQSPVSPTSAGIPPSHMSPCPPSAELQGDSQGTFLA